MSRKAVVPSRKRSQRRRPGASHGGHAEYPRLKTTYRAFVDAKGQRAREATKFTAGRVVTMTADGARKWSERGLAEIVKPAA